MIDILTKKNQSKHNCLCNGHIKEEEKEIAPDLVQVLAVPHQHGGGQETQADSNLVAEEADRGNRGELVERKPKGGQQRRHGHDQNLPAKHLPCKLHTILAHLSSA